MAVTYILSEHKKMDVIGYYTLSSMTLELSHLPGKMISKLPHYPLLPATLMGRLAVDGHCQKSVLGEILFMDVLHRSYQASQKMASFAVVVEAINHQAVEFYRNIILIRYYRIIVNFSYQCHG